jgi:hypothetical protein
MATGTDRQRKANRKRLAAQARRAALRPMSSGEASDNDASAFSTRRAGDPEAVRQLIVHITEQAVFLLAPRLTDDAMVAHLVDRLLDIELQRADVAPRQQSNAADERTHPLLVVSSLLHDGVNAMWERGWQPADFVHVAKRRCPALNARLAVAALGSVPNAASMPREWRDQLAAIGVLSMHQRTSQLLTTWANDERIDVSGALLEGLRLLALVRQLGPVVPLGEPPSRWPLTQRSASHRSGPSTTDSTRLSPPSNKTLSVIRALLAQAQGTTFPAEAEAFAAKAQALMSRYSIDAAFLDQRRDPGHASGVRTRRVHLDHPYTKEKVHLLSQIGSANRVRVVYAEFHATATIVGFGADLDLVELLFTSLLVQATTALNHATAEFGRGSTTAFRKGFWLAYAVRVGERLAQADQEARAEAQAEYGAALLPLLAERAEAVDAVIDELFGSLKTMRSRSVDAQGWHAGRTAADLASFASERSQIVT